MRHQSWIEHITTDPSTLCEPVTVLNAAQLSAIDLNDIVNCLVRMAGDPELKKSPALRTYAAGKLRPEFEQRILTTPPTVGVDLNRWTHEIFGAESFGIITNSCERWGHELTEKLSEFCSGLYDSFDPAQIRLEVVLFIGNYGFTPFGIHKDEPCRSVFHINLGPARKSMILLPISDQDFVEARRVGGTLWKDFLKRGQEFEIAPGDGFLLPANWYHIGFSPEYTVDVSITIQPISRAEQSKFWLNRIVNSCDDDLGKCDFLEATEFLLGMAGSKQSVGSWASDQFQIFCASQRSNRCFRSLPMLKSLGKSRWKAIERTRFAPEVVDVRGGVYAVSRGYVRRLKNVTEIEIARSIISHGSMFIETGMYGQSDLITWLLRTGSFLPFGEAADDLPE